MKELTLDIITFAKIIKMAEEDEMDEDAIKEIIPRIILDGTFFTITKFDELR